MSNINDLDDISETESEDMDEENNNVDNEDDDHDDEETNDVPINYRSDTPFPQDDEQENEEEFPRGVENEVVVDNDEDARVNESREGDVEIVGEEIAVEIVGETAVVPDTEDDTDDGDEEEYPLPVINTATTEEVLGISSDSDTGGTVEAAEDTLEATEDEIGIPHTPRDIPSVPEPVRSAELRSPQPGPSHGHHHHHHHHFHPRQSHQQSVVRCSRGKRFPWGDDYNETSDSEEDEIGIPNNSTPREMSSSAPTVHSVITTTTPVTIRDNNDRSPVLPSRDVVQLPRSRDFDQRRFWRQLSSTNEDLGSIEPTVTAASSNSSTSGLGLPELRVRPVSSLRELGPTWSRYTETVTPVSSVPTLPNTTIRRILPINTTDLITPPQLVEPARLEAVRSPSPVSPPQSSLYSPVQLPNLPPINAPRFEPAPGPSRFMTQGEPSSPPSHPRPGSLASRLMTLGEPSSPPSHPRRGGLLIRPDPGDRGQPPRRLEPETADRGYERYRERARDLDRIDRILELSRRTRITAEQENNRIEQERSRWLSDLRRERELNDRSSTYINRCLVRARAAMDRSRDEGVGAGASQGNDEFVRDLSEPETRDQSPAAKRPRMEAGGEDSRQYDEDMAEALSRSLMDQGARADTDPQPGCSHWGVNNVTNPAANTPAVSPAASGRGVTPAVTSPNGRGNAPAGRNNTPAASPAVPSPAAGRVITPAASPAVPSPAAEPGPDYEAMYKALEAKNKKLISELQSSLECPVCLETIRTAPVQCCRNGHLICNVCITRATTCPTCRAHMGISMSNKCVSHVANRLIDLLPHPCTNKDRGCTVEELLTVLTQHETQCRYRDVRCPVGYCLETVPMSSLSSHISSPPHNLPTRYCEAVLTHIRAIPGPPNNDINNATFLMKSFDPVRFTFGGNNFYLQTIASLDRRFLYHFVQIEGSKSDCSKYWVKISVIPCNNFTSALASTTVRPITLDQHCRDDLQAIGLALVTPERLMATLIQYDETKSQYQFKVEVEMTLS